MSKNNARVRNIAIGILAASFVGAAIVEQLRMSPEERTWHGNIIGVPYDFRMPTIEKIRANIWNENTSNILMPRAFGMGWDINFYPLFYPKRLQSSETETVNQ